MPSTEHIKERIEAAIPGAHAEVEDYTGTGDHFPLDQAKLERYHNGHWVAFGGLFRVR